MKKIFIIYKITNKITGMIYVGAHGTININDNYMGSGTDLELAIIKEGKENFIKEILMIFPTKKEMFKAERYVVNKKFVAREDTYNKTTGGGGSDGGWTDEHRKNSQRKQKFLHENNPEWVKKKAKKISKANKGKKRSEEIKKKMQILQTGKKNSAYGKCYIHNPKTQQNKRIKPEELQFYLSNGWVKGISEETKKKRKKSQKDLLKGRCWIHNPKTQQTKFIKPTELQFYLSNGWVKGTSKKIRDNMSKGQLGRKHTPETIEKMKNRRKNDKY